MNPAPRHFGNAQALRESASRRPDRVARARRLPRGFTLVETLAAVGIVSLLVGISAYAFNRLRDSNILAQSRNAVLTYAKIARSYAIAHQIETMMVVNPRNGRFELWHLNPPYGGGPFDPLSSGTSPPMSDGYAFAPVLDSGARLPIDRSGRPLAVVHPIDFADNDLRPFQVDSDANFDNLTWAAFCFDKSGKLVIRTRRIATRTYTLRNGAERNLNDRNRLLDESPDLSVRLFGPMVQGGDNGDTPITSTVGFVISERPKFRQVLGPQPTTLELVNNWLMQTRPGGRHSDAASTVILNRFSGSELVGAF